MKVTVIGSGFVGQTTAMRIVENGLAEVCLIDIVEGLVIGLISWVFSLLLAIPITSVLSYGVGMAILTSPMTPVFGVRGLLAWLIFTLFIAALASAIPARRASRLTVRDTLAYE